VAEVVSAEVVGVRHALRRSGRPPLMIWLAGAFVALTVALALFGPFIVPKSPSEQRLLLGGQAPSAQFWLGTDQLGRDIFSRVMIGTRTAVDGPIAIAVGAFVIASLLGIVAGYSGGVIDTVVMRWVDYMFALPGLLIAIVVIGIFGGGYWVAVLTMMFLFVAPDTRIVRSAALEQRSLPYIEAARTLGIARSRIMFVDIFANILPIIVAYVVLDFAYALVSLSALSFLGLGVPPGAADWGRMLYENRDVLYSNPAASLVPAAMIVALAASVNLIGDWMYERFGHRGDA
jgi:peptide/nickel transport system permease protein